MCKKYAVSIHGLRVRRHRWFTSVSVVWGATLAAFSVYRRHNAPADSATLYGGASTFKAWEKR